jgi:hypothetical protein
VNGEALGLCRWVMKLEWHNCFIGIAVEDASGDDIIISKIMLARRSYNLARRK